MSQEKENTQQDSTNKGNWFARVHSEEDGKPSWTRFAGTIALLCLFGGMFWGPIEWGAQFVGALALVFGLKGAQKWKEKQTRNPR